ncbi:MAG: 4Fe-4S binding protein [Planctomycetes bacterium]|nr:4Fe-4S binding protein [Planctomycetota bacterium]
MPCIGRKGARRRHRAKRRRLKPRWLRPPGALRDEDAFRSACTQCTACQDVCPHDSIRRLGTEFGVDAGTPAIIPDESPCYLCVDFPCIDVCEPGALQPLDLLRCVDGHSRSRCQEVLSIRRAAL